MSYFGSLMASVGDKDVQVKANPAPPVRTQGAPVIRKSTTSSATANVSVPIKRKAEGDLKVTGSKTPRINSTAVQSSKIAPKSSHGSPSGQIQRLDSKRETSRTRSSSPPVQKRERSSTPLTTKPLPKDNLATLLARAKTQVQKPVITGGYSNTKKTDKSQDEDASRRRILAARKKEGTRSKPRANNSGSDASARKSGDTRPSAASKPKVKKVVAPPEKKKRTPVVVTYKGTMRPSAKTLATQAPALIPPSAKVERYRQDYSDEEDEDEDADSYYSDDSDMMEAGIFDVDEEEELSRLEAQREDTRERKLEEKLKREKLLRKQQAYGR